MQEKIGKTLADLGMTMGIFVCHGDFGSKAFVGSDKDARDKVVQDIKRQRRRGQAGERQVDDGGARRVRPAARVGLPDGQLHRPAAAVRRGVRAARAGDGAGAAQLVDAITRGCSCTRFRRRTRSAAAVDSPACKMLFDIYHRRFRKAISFPTSTWRGTRSRYFQTGDNPGRNEPGTGEINYRNVFKHIHEKGFDGVIGMEHGKSHRRQGRRGGAGRGVSRGG